jgi:hypothetical protein
MNIITVIDESIVINIGHKNINKIAIVFHINVIGIRSQYQVFVIVTIAHQIVSGKDENNLFQ